MLYQLSYTSILTHLCYGLSFRGHVHGKVHARADFLEWLRPPLRPRTVSFTLHVPRQPSFCAAPLERSIDLPLTYGPRSLILTVTELLPCVTNTIVPKASVLCAAVRAHWLNLSPLAVLCPLKPGPYHEATSASADVAPAKTANITNAIASVLLIYCSYLDSVQQMAVRVHCYFRRWRS